MDRSPVIVTDKDGLCGVLDTTSQPAGWDDSQALIRLDDGRQVLVPRDRLVLQDDGSYHIPFRLGELEPTQETLSASRETVLTVPVIEEELHVQKRQVETGRTRITKTVHEREEVVDEPLLREVVAIERVPIQRLVEGPPPSVRYEGDTLVIPLLEEVMVVEKRVMLKEELHVRRQQTSVRDPQRVTLRSEEVTIESRRKEP
jgi:uncharacterized protein (TIGR02271 family)